MTLAAPAAVLFRWTCGTCDTAGLATSEREAWARLDSHVDGDESAGDRVEPVVAGDDVSLLYVS